MIDIESSFIAYQPLLKSLFKQYTIYDEDDKQELYLKFVEYCLRYNPVPGVSFGLYMKIMLRNYLINLRSKKNKYLHTLLPLDEIASKVAVEMLSEETMQFSIEQLIESKLLFEAYNKFTPKQKAVANLIMTGGLADIEIARKLGISKQALYEIKKLIKIKIKIINFYE